MVPWRSAYALTRGVESITQRADRIKEILERMWRNRQRERRIQESERLGTVGGVAPRCFLVALGSGRSAASVGRSVLFGSWSSLV